MHALAAERMDPSAVLRLITVSYRVTDSIDRFIVNARGNQALAFRLSCVKSLIYGMRSNVEASTRLRMPISGS